MRNKVVLFLAAYFLILLIPTPWLALQESTEARYAEIAREMLVSGSYVEPTLNGILHYHKPPFTYWAVSLGMKIFGTNDMGSRFFGIAAATVSLLFLYRTALIVTKQEETAFTSLLILAASPLFIAVSRIVATDIYLTCFTTASIYFLFRQMFGQKSLSNACWYGLFLGLGFITKGPIIFLFTLLPFLLAKTIDEKHRKVFSVREIGAAAVLFAMVALPWYVAVAVRNPELIDYFLKTQTIDRVATDRFGRSKPFWFFFAIFGSTFAPFVFHLVVAAFKGKRLPLTINILWLYIAVPFVIFTAAKSKMAPYILPMYGIASIIAAEAFHSLKVRWAEAAMKVCLPAICVALSILGFVYNPLAPLRFALLIAGVASFALCWRIFPLHEEALARATSVLVIGMGFILYQTYPSIETATKGYERMTAVINSMDPGREHEIVIYKDFLPSVSFYRGKLAIMALGRLREVGFEQNGRYKEWYATNPTELAGRIKRKDGIFLITEPKNLGDFEQKGGVMCQTVFPQRKFSAYYCTSDGMNSQSDAQAAASPVSVQSGVQ